MPLTRTCLVGVVITVAGFLGKVTRFAPQAPLAESHIEAFFTAVNHSGIGIACSMPKQFLVRLLAKLLIQRINLKSVQLPEFIVLDDKDSLQSGVAHGFGQSLIDLVPLINTRDHFTDLTETASLLVNHLTD